MGLEHHVCQILKYTLETLSFQEGRARTHRSSTIRLDVNLQLEITSVARGVGELKRRNVTGANGFLLTRFEDMASILPEGNLQGYQLQCLALFDLLTAAMMDVPHL